MRSEKEILKQEAEDAYIDEFTYDGDVESIYEAMKIHAKETSIEFFKWEIEKKVQYNSVHFDNDTSIIDNYGTYLKLSIEERYNLFIKSNRR